MISPRFGLAALAVAALIASSGCLRWWWGAAGSGGRDATADTTADATADTTADTADAGGSSGVVKVDPGCGGFWTVKGNADAGDKITGLAFDSKGRLLAAGQLQNVGTKFDLTVLRYLADGKPDMSFSTDGQLTLHMSCCEYSAEVIAISGDRVVTGGSVDYGNDDPTAWRFEADGDLDKTFGSQGYARIAISGEVQGHGIAGNDSAGYFLVGSQYDNWFMLGKLTPAGKLDATFGSSGKVVFKNTAKATGLAVAIAPDGKVVVVGRARPDGPSGDNDMAAWRFGKSGALDSSFGDGGALYHDGAAGKAGSDDGAEGLVIDAAGKIYVVGHSHNGQDLDLALWRLRASDGKLDPGFNQVGYLTHHSAAGGGGSDRGHGAVLHEGKLVVVGSSAKAGGGAVMAIWRLDAGGGLDASFGGKGYYSHAGKGSGRGLAVAVGPKGQIVVGGDSSGDAALWCLSAGAP
jgi:uncharacterized delta-60 repeat protein